MDKLERTAKRLLIAEQLEDAIDHVTVAEVLEKMAEIMHDKADHISHDWQDERLARGWHAAARRLESMAARFRREGPPGIG